MPRLLATLSNGPDTELNLPNLVERKLHQRSADLVPFNSNIRFSDQASAVLFLLGFFRRSDGRVDTCLILNKRSEKVRQPGDLCCPGGGIVPWLDIFISRLLKIHGTPLSRWSDWPLWRRQRSNQADLLSLLLATGLRESFEEMRLNPFGVRFLGILPAQQLVMFQREIYPFVCWISHQKRFYPNWEVEKIVMIPLDHLLNPINYARYRIEISFSNGRHQKRRRSEVKEFPCFLHEQDGSTERLWGATFRITMNFLKYVFDFEPPAMKDLMTIKGKLDRSYTGDGS